MNKEWDRLHESTRLPDTYRSIDNEWRKRILPVKDTSRNQGVCKLEWVTKTSRLSNLHHIRFEWRISMVDQVSDLADGLGESWERKCFQVLGLNVMRCQWYYEIDAEEVETQEWKAMLKKHYSSRVVGLSWSLEANGLYKAETWVIYVLILIMMSWGASLEESGTISISHDCDRWCDSTREPRPCCAIFQFNYFFWAGIDDTDRVRCRGTHRRTLNCWLALTTHVGNLLREGEKKYLFW